MFSKFKLFIIFLANRFFGRSGNNYLEIPKVLETERLLLRYPKLEDSDFLFREIMQDKEVMRYLSWKSYEDLETTMNFFSNYIKMWKSNADAIWTVVRKADNQIVGFREFHVRGNSVSVGFVLARRFWNNGYSTETLKTLIDFAFSSPDIYKLWAICDVDNVAPIKVMERVGMEREGRLRRCQIHPNISSEPRDCYIYSIVK